MTTQRFALSAVALGGLVWLVSGLRAQSLDVKLGNPEVTVIEGTTVVDFYATLSNPNPLGTAPIYLNGDTSTTSSLFLTVDDTPFFEDAPISLSPGQTTTSIELFALDLSASIPPGAYSGNVFSILGGADGGAGTAFNDLADAKFAATVAAPASAPEVNTSSALNAATMLACLIAILRGRRSAHSDG